MALAHSRCDHPAAARAWQRGGADAAVLERCSVRNERRADLDQWTRCRRRQCREGAGGHETGVAVRGANRYPAPLRAFVLTRSAAPQRRSAHACGAIDERRQRRMMDVTAWERGRLARRTCADTAGETPAFPGGVSFPASVHSFRIAGDPDVPRGVEY